MLSITKKTQGFLQTLVMVLWLNTYCFADALWRIITGYMCPYITCYNVERFFRPVHRVVKGSHPIHTGKTMFLANHRSWTDFFVDGRMSGGSSYLSRMLVAFAIPGPGTCGFLFNFVWFFNRSPGIDRKWFTHFFEVNWSKRPDFGVVVYPEGHRFKGEGSLKLKTGCLEVAYNMKCPCQILLANGKENVIDEVNYHVNYGSVITWCVSPVLDPTKFESKEKWFDFVNKQWEATFEVLNKCESPELTDGPLPGVNVKEIQYEKLQTKRRLIVLSGFIAAFSIVYAVLKWVKSLFM